MLGVFDVVGPVMIGPSSSHTAGAVRLGRMALAVLAAKPVRAEIYLHGSFATTGKGHGTDLALVAGLLGMSTDDENIVNSHQIAREQGLDFVIATADLGLAHPNTAKIVVRDAAGREKTVVGASVGGGNILVTQINDFGVNLTGEYHTVCAIYKEQIGMVAKVSKLMAEGNINIARMQVSREGRYGNALMVVETDDPIPEDIVLKIKNLKEIDTAFILEPVID